MASALNESWFYLAGDRPVGPVSAQQLRAAVAAGLVGPETMVRKASWAEWRPAWQVPGLVSQPQAAPPVPPAAVPPPPPSPARPTAPASFNFPVPSAAPRRPGNGKKRKKSSAAPLLLALGLFAGCAALAAIIWVIQNQPQAPKRVARAPQKVEIEKPKEKPEPPKEELRTFTAPEVKPAAEADPEAAYNRTTFEILAPPKVQNHIDDLVFAKWKELKIEPANRCSDAVFLRRVYLDVIGTLPTVKEAKAFLTDKTKDKRAKLIDALLQRPEFADYWAMKWSDILRVKAEFPINLWPNASQAYHRWLRHSIRDNMPYDKFVRLLLTSSGSNFRVPQVNFYRALQSKTPAGIAQAVALAFMGTRTDKWPKERLEGMAGFFTKIGYKPTGEWKEEIVIFDPYKHLAAKPEAAKAGTKKAPEKKAKPAPPPKPVFPDGTSVEIPEDKDPRVVFADWLITPQNPWFCRHIVNRIWYWLEGRGIVHEADDIRPDNPPSNPELLNYLGEELAKNKYDVKHIFRLILNSATYQLSSIPKSKDPAAEVHFASYTVRRLEAEVLIDALNQITGTTEAYTSIIPEPYTFVPENVRTICLPDGSITSSFLELFGRPPRDSGMESERNNKITAGQRLHLLNSSHIRNKLRDGPGMKKLLEEGNATENLYLAILSRLPSGDDGGGGQNLAWMLINSTEFLFKH